MVGSKVQEQEQALQLLMTLKDVVKLVMSPTYRDESIGYLALLLSIDVDFSVDFHKGN